MGQVSFNCSYLFEYLAIILLVHKQGNSVVASRGEGRWGSLEKVKGICYVLMERD